MGVSRFYCIYVGRVTQFAPRAGIRRASVMLGHGCRADRAAPCSTRSRWSRVRTARRIPA
ncbi:MAG: hypothetical protein H0U76_12310 [Ktedonobacteraceae bacterium]|nr:hypothetical protein [Ktedonobacteraceae bacterium]